MYVRVAFLSPFQIVLQSSLTWSVLLCQRSAFVPDIFLLVPQAAPFLWSRMEAASQRAADLAAWATRTQSPYVPQVDEPDRAASPPTTPSAGELPPAHATADLPHSSVPLSAAPRPRVLRRSFLWTALILALIGCVLSLVWLIGNFDFGHIDCDWYEDTSSDLGEGQWVDCRSPRWGRFRWWPLVGLVLCIAVAFIAIGAIYQWCGLGEVIMHSRLRIAAVAVNVIGCVMVSLCFLAVWRFCRLIFGWIIHLTQLAITCCVCDYDWFDHLWSAYPTTNVTSGPPCCLPQYAPFCLGEVCATASSGVLLVASYDVAPPRTIPTPVRQENAL